MRSAITRLLDFLRLPSGVRRLLAVVGLVALLGIGLGIAWTYWINANLLRHMGQDIAMQWVESLRKSLDLTGVFKAGVLTPEARKALGEATSHSDVFRYRFYNSDGVIVAAMRPEDVGRRNSERFFVDTVAEGRVHAVTKRNRPGSPVEHYTVIYLPEMRGTAFVGAIEAHVDIGGHVVTHSKAIRVTTVGLIALFLASVSVVFVIILRNILAREKAEARLRDAIETISEGFLMFDAEDRLVLCNSRFRELYAVASDLFVPGAKFEDIVRAGVQRGQYPEASGRVEDWIAERMKQHRELQEPIERQLPDGRWVKITETRTSDGSTVGVRTDITDLKARERQLRDSEERLRQVVDSLQEGFVLYDAEDRVVMWNEKWREIHNEVEDIVREGATFEEIARASVARKLYPEAFGREEEFIADRIARHRNPGEPIIRQMHDGRWYIIREARTVQGGIFAIDIDISDLKHAEEEASEARYQAEKAAKAKSEFLASMSHELRTPLSAVIGFSELIKKHAELNVSADRIPEYIDAIHSSGQYLLNLINDLLDFSKFEAGKLELYEEEIDLGELIGDLTEQIAQEVASARLRLLLPNLSTLPVARVDETRIRQVILNLLSNAIKFTPEGGEVELSVSRCKNGCLAIAVRDTGIGMTGGELEEIGEPFRQFGSPYARKKGGTGLGVSLAKALAEIHGGTLKYESELGAGTTATLILPADRVVRPDAAAN